MSTIRVVRGTGTGPTALAAYDAALADAGVHNFNLVRVSSVVPPETPVEVVGTAPDLGTPGDRLTVVEARATAAGPGRVAACLGWDVSVDGPGLFYESSGESLDAVERRVRDGLRAGRALREWTWRDDGPTLESVALDAPDGTYACALVLGVYGRGESIV